MSSPDRLLCPRLHHHRQHHNNSTANNLTTASTTTATTSFAPPRSDYAVFPVFAARASSANSAIINSATTATTTTSSTVSTTASSPLSARPRILRARSYNVCGCPKAVREPSAFCDCLPHPQIYSLPLVLTRNPQVLAANIRHPLFRATTTAFRDVVASIGVHFATVIVLSV